METASVFLSLYISLYHKMLTEIELFDLQNPDEIKGHNVLVKLADEYRQLAKVFDYTELPPLPEKK